MQKRPLARAFGFRGGVGVSGTRLTCDPLGAAGGVVFLSHACAVGEPGRGRFPIRRGRRSQVIATEATLALLGRTGERLRAHALPVPLGRPFALGEMRIELFASGHLLGAASLLCEISGRRSLYAGAIHRGSAALGAPACELRRAEALCLDATYGHPRFVFPPREEALAAVRVFVREAHARGRSPVLLAAPFGGAMDIAVALAADGVCMRAHRAVVAAAAAFRRGGVATPALGRFHGRLGASEALLWPPEARRAPLLGALASPRFAFVSGSSLDPEATARIRADAAIPLANQSGYLDLLAYAEEVGAPEVALCRGCARELAEALKRRGHDVYVLGSPQQIELFV